MARKPNYKFERQERQRAKDLKKATRKEATKERVEKRNADKSDVDPNDEAAAGAPEEAPSQLQEDGDPAQ